MSKLFISYRRDDSAGYARAIHSRLVQHFSKDQVFMDVDTVEPGADFVQAIQKAVGECDVLVALIGKRWAGRESSGISRLDNEKDYVRLEVSMALARDVRVIPVLVDGMTMPNEDSLPSPLQPITRRNAIEVSNTRFHYDVDQLITAVRKILDTTGPKEPEMMVIPPGTEVYEPFRADYAIHAEQLGKPLARGQLAEDRAIYQAVHQHAIVIWLQPKMRFYRLKTRENKWDWKPDPDWEKDSKWYRDSDLRRRFKPPTDFGPPYAGLAARWDANPADWKWIGWRKWHCYFSDDSEHLPAYQEFERGIVIAGLRPALIEPSAPQMFILFNDGRWLSVSMTGVKAPSFKIPDTNPPG